MAQFDLTNFNRFILSTEDDANSPVTEELMQQIRQNLVGLLLLILDTGESGSATSDPPNDTTGVLTDSGAAYDADEHNGRTLLITSGNAKGLFYTIDDTTTTTLVCAGDNLYSDGVRSGDTYKILYDCKVNLDGHDHDGVNSKGATVPAASISSDKLKTTADTTGASGTLNASTAAYVTMQDYCFAPNMYGQNGDVAIYATSGDNADTTARLKVYNTDGANQRAYHIRWRYVTATDHPFLYALRSKITGLIEHLWTCDDPPPGCWGLKEKPKDFVPPIQVDNPGDYEEIILFDYPRDGLAEIQAYAKEKKKQPYQALNDFEFDSKKKRFHLKQKRRRKNG